METAIPDAAIPDAAIPPAAARLVSAAVEQRVATAAVLAVGRGARTYGVKILGVTRDGPQAVPVTADTLFDLASLTKVVATTPAILRLYDAGDLDLDDPVGRYLPAYAEGGKAAVTLRHLLSHSSGLPAHRAFHRLPGTPASRLAAAAEEPLEAAPGTRVVYSDIGFMLLGAVIARVTETSLEKAARELVFAPLGLESTGYLPDPDRVCAATEPDPGTGEPVCGRVHDENASAVGGVAGHAGVFSTAGDLVRYLQDGWLADDAFLSERARAAAVACQTPGLDGRRGLGWTLAGDRWDHMTAAWPLTRAGHTGFTGTSLAFDPDSGLWTVLLTNAVHFGRDHGGIALLRRTVHAAVAAWAERTSEQAVEKASAETSEQAVEETFAETPEHAVEETSAETSDQASEKTSGRAAAEASRNPGGTAARTREAAPGYDRAVPSRGDR